MGIEVGYISVSGCLFCATSAWNFVGGEGIKNRRILPRLQRSIDLPAYSKLLACEREIKPRPTYDKSRYVGGEGFVKERERERICQREEIREEKGRLRNSSFRICRQALSHCHCSTSSLETFFFFYDDSQPTRKSLSLLPATLPCGVLLIHPTMKILVSRWEGPSRMRPTTRKCVCVSLS